jgi:hypothetical protein
MTALKCSSFQVSACAWDALVGQMLAMPKLVIINVHNLLNFRMLRIFASPSSKQANAFVASRQSCAALRILTQASKQGSTATVEQTLRSW